MLLNVLSKAASVIGDIISDPIGFLGNLVDGVKSGVIDRDYFTIKVPKGATKGEHYGVVWVQQRAKPKRGASFGVSEEARVGIRNSRVAFCHPKSTGGVLTEIVQPAVAWTCDA